VVSLILLHQRQIPERLFASHAFASETSHFQQQLIDLTSSPTYEALMNKATRSILGLVSSRPAAFCLLIISDYVTIW
jgi:hypothetical protein